MFDFRKIFILGLWLLLSCPLLASAKEKIVLVTAIDFWSTGPAYTQWYYKEYTTKLEKVFKEQFSDAKYDLQFKHFANQYDVWQILRSSENAAVFIMAHGGQTTNILNPSQTKESVIVDRVGFDMTPIFQGVNPRLRFLGMLGCYSEGTAEKIKSETLVVQGVQHKILTYNWIPTLEEMIKTSRKIIDQPRPTTGNACKKSLGYELEIRRKISLSDLDKASPAVRVKVGKKVLGVFPPANPGDESILKVFIPAASGELQNQNFKIVLTTGAQASITRDDLNLGDFEFHPSWENAHWLLYTDNNGEPLGVTQMIYNYTGSLDGIEKTAYSEFDCTETESGTP